MSATVMAAYASWEDLPCLVFVLFSRLQQQWEQRQAAGWPTVWTREMSCYAVLCCAHFVA